MGLLKQFRQSGISAETPLPTAHLQLLLKSRKRFHQINHNRVAPRGPQGVMVWR